MYIYLHIFTHYIHIYWHILYTCIMYLHMYYIHIYIFTCYIYIHSIYEYIYIMYGSCYNLISRDYVCPITFAMFYWLEASHKLCLFSKGGIMHDSRRWAHGDQSLSALVGMVSSSCHVSDEADSTPWTWLSQSFPFLFLATLIGSRLGTQPGSSQLRPMWANVWQMECWTMSKADPPFHRTGREGPGKEANSETVELGHNCILVCPG